MSSQRALIVGCGLVGNAVGIQLYKKGFTVYGIRRNHRQIATCISALSIDLNLPLNQWQDLLPQVDKILISLTPNQRTPKGYRQCYVENVKKIIKAYDGHKIDFYFLSSTAVYSNNEEVITSTSKINPSDWNGEILSTAEETLLQQTSATIINSAGIYGVMRWWLFDRVSGLSNRPLNWNKVSNRIHQEDLIRFIVYLMVCSKQEKLDNRYILCDEYSCSYNEIIGWLCEQNFPVEKSIATNAQKNLSLSEGKKCQNNLSQYSDFDLYYPTFKQGLQEQIPLWLGWQKMTDFQKKILFQVWQIPWGQTKSYRELGEIVDSRAYRAIGQVLRKNPCAPWIPCHRVIASDGTIGGFMGAKNGDAIDTKRQLLLEENIVI